MFGGYGDASRYGCPSVGVGARIGPMKPGKYLSEKGAQPEEGRATLGTLACRYDAGDEAQTDRSEWLHRAASDRQAHRFGTRPPISRGSGATFPGACSGQGHHASALPAQPGVANGTPASPGFGRRRGRSEEQRVANITRPPNNAMHQTRRGGVPASRAVVEARLAGDCECYAT